MTRVLKNRLADRRATGYVRRVCHYAETSYKLHYACVSCRVAFKRHPATAPGGHRCPNCSGPLTCAGHDFAAPARRDVKAWSVVAAVLAAGLRYEGFEPCGCGREPKFRPRTRAQLRARRIAATREGTPLAVVLERRDPQLPA
ncbi:hypothetical protein [Streptomyces sp. NBC_00285]|uniref:hypothetical protein n=1 Tax=Streptomyces sp. NBC_00285 TaxID=2975700 RepID=UPI003FA7D986